MRQARGVIVAGQHFSPHLLQRLEQEGAGLSRRQLACLLCQWLAWKGPAGRWQEMSARKALAALQRSGHLQLPPPIAPPPPRRVVPTRPAAATPQPPLHRSLDQLGSVTLELVPPGRSTQGRVWRELFEQEHYLGAGPLCAAQLRYLIASPPGYLGGLAFSAAAWRLAPRDQWLGWNDVARTENLHRVVNNSRFLIRAHVQVPGLASYSLAQVVRRLPADWQARYGYGPVLVEMFVQRARFAGVSYAAANWQALGLTQGRGRQDATHQTQRGQKIIWVKPLAPDFRAVLHLTKLGRATPAVPCTVYFEEHEWKALVAFTTQCAAPPTMPPSLWVAMLMVATLGGWLGRKSDGPPGAQVLWRGLQRLDDLAAMYQVLAAPPSVPRSPPVSGNPDYG